MIYAPASGPLPYAGITQFRSLGSSPFRENSQPRNGAPLALCDLFKRISGEVWEVKEFGTGFWKEKKGESRISAGSPYAGYG